MARTRHTIDYVELPALNMAAAKAFYAGAFGWGFQDWGPDYAAFEGAGLQGGLRRVETPPPRGGVLVILYSDDLAASEAAIAAVGGAVHERGDFPGGRRIHVRDPNGVEIAIWSDRDAQGGVIGV